MHDVKMVPQLLKGQLWAVTGHFSLHTRREWEVKMMEYGATIVKRVTKETCYLLEGVGTEYGSKVLGALELNIRAVSEFELQSALSQALVKEMSLYEIQPQSIQFV